MAGGALKVRTDLTALAFRSEWKIPLLLKLRDRHFQRIGPEGNPAMNRNHVQPHALLIGGCLSGPFAFDFNSASIWPNTADIRHAGSPGSEEALGTHGGAF